MDTRLIYGPFDLSDALNAVIYFLLWRDIEPSYDYLAFEVSTNGSNFTELERWDGTHGWESETEWLSNYVGHSSVWIAWRFASDSSVTFSGPYVDYIDVEKQVRQQPGQVTVKGTFAYADRNGQQQPARFMNVYVYDQDVTDGPDLLATTTTDGNGFFLWGPISNSDDDPADPDPRLDLYIEWETDYTENGLARHKVTHFDGYPYRWASYVNSNTPDGSTVDFSSELGVGSVSLKAMWLFQDLRRGWEYVSAISNPGYGTARWEDGQLCFPLAPGISPCNSFFWPDVPLNGIFVRDDQVGSSDIVIHELGHEYMYNTRGSFWYSWSTLDDFLQCGLLGHGMFEAKTALCAWTEGWSDFLPLAVNGDPCFDFGLGPCTGIADRDYYNLEMHSRNDNVQPFTWGDTVEARIAGALYDLYDNTNEAPWWDTPAFGFGPIWTIVRSAPSENSFRDFWNSWAASPNNKHTALQAIYQNTIDYDTAPIIDMPDVVKDMQNVILNQAIDLAQYSSDWESTQSELGWQIINITDSRCGISLNNVRYLRISPAPDWVGYCDATATVSDGIKVGTDAFRVNILQERGRSYLPFVFK